MPTFTGQLSYNEIYTSIFNMIISQQVFDRIGDSSELVDEAKVDGSKYGNMKLYYAADALETHPWGGDSEATNLLAIKRAADPEVQTITLDIFRQIDLTVDSVLTCRAFMNEETFQSFNAIIESMLGKTKRIYDVTTYSAFIGTDEVVAQNHTVTVPTNGTPENEAKQIAQDLADLVVQITKVNRKYNEYGQITKFEKGEIKIVWNSKFVNAITKKDLPAIFHTDGLFEEDFKRQLPPEYFGHINSAAKVADGTATRALEELVISSSGTDYHYWPGELIGYGLTAPAGKSYQETSDVICKIYVELPKYMSGFVMQTSFVNAKSLTTNKYLTFGHNVLEHFKAYPCVTLKLAKSGTIDPVHVIVDELPAEGE